MAEIIPGQRQTVQRRAILGAIQEATGPLTVDDIHQRARRQLPNLGIATVYRNLKVLLASQQITAVLLPGGQTRYEISNLGHHHHFRCRICTRVFVLDGCLMPIPNGTSLPGGFEVDGHELTLFGTCPHCRRRRRPG